MKLINAIAPFETQADRKLEEIIGRVIQVDRNFISRLIGIALPERIRQESAENRQETARKPLGNRQEGGRGWWVAGGNGIQFN